MTTRKVLLSLVLALALAGCSREPVLKQLGGTGIKGRVTIGPNCPVQRQDSPCPDRPYQAQITITNDQGKTVESFIAGTDGTFRVDLQPGHYTLVPKNGKPLPRAEPVPVVVQEGKYTDVEISYDSGIR